MMKSLMSKFCKIIKPKQTPLALIIIGLDNSGKTSILNNLISSQRDNDFSSISLDRHQTSSDELLSASSERSELVISSKFDRSEDQFRNIAPTVGYNYERIQYKSASLTVLDFSGQNRYRSLWQEFYDSVDGIVFVIDSSDLIRLVVVRDELELLLSHQYFASLSLPSSSSIKSTHHPIIQKQVKISQGRLIQCPLDVLDVECDNENKSKTSRSVGVGCRVQIPILFLANKTDLANSLSTEVIVKMLNLSQLSETKHPWLIQATSVTLNKGITEGFDWLINKLS